MHASYLLKRKIPFTTNIYILNSFHLLKFVKISVFIVANVGGLSIIDLILYAVSCHNISM